MAAASAWKIFDYAKEVMSDGTLDMDDAGAGVFKCALIGSGYTADQTDTDFSADIQGNEIAGSYGYTTGGAALTNVTWANTSGTTKWDADDVVWSASGGSITARFAVIYHVSSDIPICLCVLDNTPADVTATDGNDLTVEMNASGIFTVSGGWS